jgi:AcrR family transcriptional regulator
MTQKRGNKHCSTLKKKIITCASKMFEEQGVRSVKMDEIAAKLSMSKRTLYEIFDDKEDLLIECMKQNHDIQIKKARKIIDESNNVLEVILKMFEQSVKKMHSMNLKFFSDAHQYPKAIKLIKDGKKEEFENAVLFFRQGIAQGLFRSDIDFEIFCFMLREQINMLLGMTDWRKHDFFDIYEFVIFTFLRGVSTKEGMDVIDKFIVEYRKKEHSKRKVSL